MMTPTDEAAQILTRLFEALARQNRKTLNARSKEAIRRACELLASAGDELDDLLDDLPPPAREYTTVSFDARPPEVERWKQNRGRS